MKARPACEAFRARVGWYWLWSLVVAGGATASAAFVGLYGLVRVGWRGSPAEWSLLLTGFLLVMVSAAIVPGVARLLAMRANAAVHVDETGIAVTDWRRATVRLGWEEIREMRWRVGSRLSPGSTVWVRSTVQAAAIPVFVERLDALVAEIAARADLKCVQESALQLGARYKAGREPQLGQVEPNRSPD